MNRWPVLVTRSLPRRPMDAILERCDADVEECTRRGVMATNTPDVLTETTADLAWALLMAAARRTAEGDRFLRSKTPWIWGPEMMLGQDVHGATLGLVGFG